MILDQNGSLKLNQFPKGADSEDCLPAVFAVDQKISPSVTEGILDDSIQHPLPLYLLIHAVPLLTTYCVPDFSGPRGMKLGRR